jgi:hypothetical protein
VCDAAYLCQVEQLERSALAQVALIPHLDETARKNVPTVDGVREEFDAWLVSEPDGVAMTPQDQETALMYRLLGVGGKG